MLGIIFYGLFSAVCTTAVQSATTPSVECPYRNPLSQGMSCLQDGFATVQYKSLATDPPSENDPPESNGATAEADISVDGPDVPPPSTLDLSEEFIRYFCSDNGRQMVDCAMNVSYLCTNNVQIEHFQFNPVQAARARELCPDIMKDLRRTLDCINKTAKTQVFLSCSDEAYQKNFRPASYANSHCRVLADAYNCYTHMEEQFCEPKIIDFSVSLMRVMEDRQCTPIVDRVYVAPVSKATNFVLSSSLVVLLLLLLTGS